MHHSRMTRVCTRGEWTGEQHPAAPPSGRYHIPPLPHPTREHHQLNKIELQLIEAHRPSGGHVNL